jgi:hypothetical protein
MSLCGETHSQCVDVLTLEISSTCLECDVLIDPFRKRGGKPHPHTRKPHSPNKSKVCDNHSFSVSYFLLSASVLAAAALASALSFRRKQFSPQRISLSSSVVA